MAARPPLRLRSTWAIACVWLAACGSQASNQRPSPAPEAPTPSLRILAVTDMDGALEPCGCTSRPLGGIDRLAARLAGLRSEAPSLMFVVGNTFVGPERNEEPAFAAQTRLEEQTLAGVLQALDVDAIVPGPSDLQLAWSRLVAMADQGELPYLDPTPGGESDDSATPTETAAAQRPAPARTASLHAGDLSVGVFAVGPSGAGDALEGVGPTVAMLRGRGADIVVALVTTSRRESRRIARVDGVDLVIQAGLDRAEALAPSQEGGALVVNGGRQGQGLLVVDLYRRGDGRFQNVSAWTQQARAETIRREAASLASRIQAWERAGDANASDLAEQRARLRALRARASAAEAAVERIPAEGNVVSARLLELSAEAPRDPTIRALLQAHDRRVGEANRHVWSEIAPPEVPQGEAGYVGAERCGVCHEAALSWWQQTPHGHAYTTLEGVQKQFDLECVGCHVTGYRRPGGSNVAHVGALAGVGCEVCHGPGSLHVSAPERAHLEPSPAGSVCLRCHTEAHSDLFDFAAYRTLLIVPGHGQPENP